jgi:flagellar hook-basal body complex protein FliE
MNVDPVGFIAPAQEMALAPAAERAGAADFSGWMTREMGAVNDKIAQADTLLQRLATGQVDNLHQVMVSLEDAKLSFQLLVQVRNKLLEAYQDILRMQV